MGKNYFLLLLLVVFLWAFSPCIAANKTFTGPGNFSNPARWSGGTLPLAGDNITIDGTCVFDDTRNLTYTRLNLGNPNPAGTITWPAGSTNNLIVQRIQMNNAASRIDMTNGGILTVTSDWSMNNAAATFVSGTGTVVLTIPGFTLPNQVTDLYNLTIQSPGSIMLSGNTAIRGNLTISSGSLDVTFSNFTLSVAGNFVNNGTFQQRTGTVTLNGTALQTISGTTATTFNNLVVNNTSGLSLAQSISVNAALTFTAGRITTGVNTVIINSSGSVSGAAAGRYVNGRLRKTIPAGSNVNVQFEIGNNTTYNPALLTFSAVSVSGTLTAVEVSGDHPSIGSSCIDPLKSVNYYWQFTPAGITFTRYSVTLNYTAADYDAISNPFGFGVQLLSGTWRMPLISSRTATTVTGSGFAAFGALAVGESKTPASVSVLASPGTNVCPGTAVTFTAAPVNGGATPVYQWLKNGSTIGSNSSSYTDPSLNSADSIRVMLTSSDVCVLVKPVSSALSVITPIIGVWMGTTNTSWSTASNWCGNSVPASTDNIVINSGVPNMPVLTGNTICNNFTLSAGATLGLSGYSFTVNGNFNAPGTFSGAATSDLVINGTGGVSSLNLTQTVRATRTLRNLTLNRPSSTITLGDSLLLTGTLTLSNGSLNTSDVLRLMSTSSGTARIGAITGGNISGKVTMERYLPGGTGWHLLASPVTGCTLNDWSDDFIMGGFPGSPYPTVQNSSILTYNESTAGIYDYGYEAPTGMGLSLAANKGFWAYIINTPLTIDVTGPVIKGIQNVPLSYTNNDASTEIGWNLIANPYPSAIDWDSPNITRTNMDAAIYLFNGSSEQYTTYVGGIGINGGSRYIASSQGMLVQATAPGASITFRETSKTAVDPSFMKLQNTQPSGDILKLSVTGAGGSDETVIRFDASGTTGYDQGYDASKLINWDANAPAICTVTGQNYSINTYPSLTQSYVIPLRIVVMSSGTYTIKRDSGFQLPATSCIVLEDKKTGVKKDFSVDSAYSFWISDTTWAPRFLLHISEPVHFTTRNEICTDGRIIAHLPSAGNYNVTWQDDSSTIIRQSVNATIADTLSNVSEGVYTFSISSSSQFCSMLTEQVNVGEDTLDFTSTSFSPSCSETTDGSIEIESSNGNNLSVAVTSGNVTWYSGVMNQSAVINDLPAGSYKISWSNACTSDSMMIQLSPQYSIAADFLALNDTVNQNGTITFINTSSGAGLFYWDMGDGTILYDSDPVHQYTAPGIYHVIMIASNSFCSDTATKTIYVSPTTVRSVTDNSVVMYLKDGTSLVIRYAEIFKPGSSVTIIDMSGRKVLSYICEYKSEFAIPVESLSSGIYSVLINQDNSLSTGRFMIER